MNDDGAIPSLPDQHDVKKRQMILIAIIIVFILAGLAYVILTSTAEQVVNNQQTAATRIDLTSPGTSKDPIQDWVLANENMFRGMQESQVEEKEAMQKQITTLLEEINQLKKGQLALEEDQGQIDYSKLPAIPLPPPSDLAISQPQILPAPISDIGSITSPKQSSALAKNVGKPPEAPKGIVTIKFNQRGSNKRAHISDTVPAGSFGEAVLLSGLDAPTGGLAERNPHPVLLELIDNGNLPNRYQHKVKRCRLVGSGTGNISDERAYVRLERITCVLRNGDIVSEVATGTVTGEDGVNGMRGRLVSKQGQLIANAFLAGSLSGIGDSITSSFTTVATSANGTVSSFDPDKTAEAGLASGLSNTMEKIADWYFKRAEETYPIIEIKAGRIVTIFLTEDLPLNANLLANYTVESADD